MKKVARILFLAGVFMAMLCVTAMAADDAEAGMYGITGDVKPLTADGGEINSTTVAINDKTETLYQGAVKLEVAVSGAVNGRQYLVLALNGTGTPTESNIVYIDQNESGTFTVYPKDLVSGKTYYIYITSDADGPDKQLAEKEVGSFTYYAPYILGDVNGNDVVGADDAFAALKMAVGLQPVDATMLRIADINGNGTVGADDAFAILKLAVGLKI